MKRAIILLLALCFSMSVATGNATAEDEQAEVVVQPGAQEGDTTICPVAKSTLTVTTDTASVEYEGQTYYLCCAGCIKPFMEDPDKYLSKDDENDD